MNTVVEFLDKSRTKPVLRDQIVLGLTRWRHSLPDYDPQDQLTHQSEYQDQALIGWKNLMEGFMSKQWRHTQDRYYRSEGLQRSSKRCARDLLRHLHQLAWAQWDHRNTAKHRTICSGQKEARQRLDKAIINEMIRGFDDLPVGDRYHFRHNLLTLLQRHQDFKQAWFSNVSAARQRQARRTAHDDDLLVHTRETTSLLRYFKTRRDM